MKHDLKKDWERVVNVWNTYKDNHWNSTLIISISIYDLRKIDRGIDYPLRRLLDSEEYGNRIQVYGCPTSHFGRHPFKWNNRHWLLIRIKFSKKHKNLSKSA